jgi:hypothetical protein
MWAAGGLIDLGDAMFYQKKVCMTAAEWTGALMQIRLFVLCVILNATVTQYTSLVYGVSLPTD